MDLAIVSSLKTLTAFAMALTWIVFSPVVRGQGQVIFNNRVTGSVDARVLLPDGSGAGAGFKAQLVLVQADGTLMPLLPITTFRTSSSATQGYVNSVVVTIPGVPVDAAATLFMRAYNGDSYESAPVRGESNQITITTGGGTLPPRNLTDLMGFTLKAYLPPTISTIPSQTIRLGQPSSVITFDVADAETPVDKLTVTISSSNKALVPDTQIILGGVGEHRELVIVPAADQLGTTTITVTVADTDGGRKSVSFELHVIGILITTQPQSQTVSVGANVILTVGVAGPAPFNYQWQRNGLPISGATSSILVLSNVQRADAGEYKVAVSNETGAVLSAAATLTILSIGPENDAFINRIPLTGMSVIAEGSNIDATNESDEPKHDGLHLATAWVWWSWKASKYGDVRISTTGSSIDTLEAMHNNMNNY